MLRNPTLRKLIDQRQNWIFMTPEVQNSATEEILATRENGPETLSNGKSKKAVDRYFDAAASKETSNPSKLENLGNTNGANPSGFSKGPPVDVRESVDARNGLLQSRPSGSSLTSGFERTRSLDARTPILGALPGGLDSKYESPISPSLDFSTGLRSDPARQAELRRREDFRQLIQPGRPSALTGITDPVILWSDATRRDLQPVTAAGLDELTGDKGRRNFLSGIPTPDDVYKTARPNFLEDLNRKVLGRDTFSSAGALLPSPVETFRPKTMPFDMPKRHF